MEFRILDRRIATFSDQNQWEQIGREMGSSTQLWKLRLIEPRDIDTLPTESKRSLKALYEGLKHNVSIRDLSVHFRDNMNNFLFSIGSTS